MDFPFARNTRYSLGALRNFEAELHRERQRDPTFSAAVRSNRVPWAKVRNEELLPVLLFSDGRRLANGDQFELMSEGHSVDVRLYTPDDVAYQITIADPAWQRAGPASHGGYMHHLRMEQLQVAGFAFGGGNVRREDGVVISEPHARSIKDDMEAAHRRLVEAIQRKREHSGKGVSLLVYARGYRFLLIDVDLERLVEDAVAAAGPTRFERVNVVDERFCWTSTGP